MEFLTNQKLNLLQTVMNFRRHKNSRWKFFSAQKVFYRKTSKQRLESATIPISQL